ncbi:MAG: HEAT repeat domain-containing protein, partial [Phycisphaerales bacterium]
MATAGPRSAFVVCLALVWGMWGPGAALAGSVAEQKGQPRIAQPLLTFEEKMSWILMLEDRRILRDPTPPAPSATQSPATPARGKATKNAPVAPPPPPSPDVLRLLNDSEARIRRRAALAVGRVGLADGVTPLSQLLVKDTEPEVRQMAAFALGLIGSRTAVDPLRAALADPTPIVQGRAAEAMGLLDDTASAPAIASMVSARAADACVGALDADDLTHPQPPAVEAFRLGLYALTRLKAWGALAPLLVDAGGQPVSRW